MRAAMRWGVTLGSLNVFFFAAMLIVREPQYGHLQQMDIALHSGALQFTTADPLFLAGRAFYSGAHVADVPFFERCYFLVNSPAMLGAIKTAYRFDLASSASRSWVLAVIFAALAGVEALLLGLVFSWTRDRLRGAA